MASTRGKGDGPTRAERYAKREAREARSVMREFSRLMVSMSKAARKAETSSLQHKQVRGTEGKEGLGDSSTREGSTEEAGESEERGEDHTETARQGGDKEAQEVLLVQGELGGRETQQRETGEDRQRTTGEPLLYTPLPSHQGEHISP